MENMLSFFGKHEMLPLCVLGSFQLFCVGTSTTQPNLGFDKSLTGLRHSVTYYCDSSFPALLALISQTTVSMLKYDLDC